MTVLPKLKRDISTFIFSEEGKISQRSVVVIGSVIATGIIASSLAAQTVEAGTWTHTNYHQHTNSAGLTWDEPKVVAEHVNHTNHHNHSNCSGKGC